MFQDVSSGSIPRGMPIRIIAGISTDIPEETSVGVSGEIPGEIHRRIFEKKIWGSIWRNYSRNSLKIVRREFTENFQQQGALLGNP